MRKNINYKQEREKWFFEKTGSLKERIWWRVALKVWWTKGVLNLKKERNMQNNNHHNILNFYFQNILSNMISFLPNVNYVNLKILLKAFPLQTYILWTYFSIIHNDVWGIGLIIYHTKDFLSPLLMIILRFLYCTYLL